MASERMGHWIVLFQTGPWDLRGLSTDGGEQLRQYTTREEAEEAVEGHLLEDHAILVDLSRESTAPQPDAEQVEGEAWKEGLREMQGRGMDMGGGDEGGIG